MIYNFHLPSDRRYHSSKKLIILKRMSVNRGVVSKENDIFPVINESSQESSVYGIGYLLNVAASFNLH